MWQIGRDKLNSALDVIAMVPEKLGIPSSEYIWVRFSHGRVTMSVASYISGEVYLEGDGEWPFKENFYLDRRTFVPWVNAARESKDKHRFQFERKKDQLYLTHGTRTVKFDYAKKVSGYGDLKKINVGHTHSVPALEELKEMLRCGSNCAVADTIQPHLNCVLATSKGSKVISYAASDYVFYLGEGNLERDEVLDSVPFPLFLINLLNAEGLKRISCVGKYVLLKFKHGCIWQPISEEAVKKFPINRIKKY